MYLESVFAFHVAHLRGVQEGDFANRLNFAR
jgi:hypothetical protein